MGDAGGRGDDGRDGMSEITAWPSFTPFQDPLMPVLQPFSIVHPPGSTRSVATANSASKTMSSSSKPSASAITATASWTTSKFARAISA
ncbi:hypothetical protein [Frankia sp. AgB32]|uniref:hypothetical protein n=1 Tax=Frankia sp. AgB32 TaxID=631119 RepID=UPI00200BDC0A|nr:hypothetical protein [Frankia sp. AgB32]MCK9896049.1 hypothetical protein [Frankia sp. AgB32]